MSNPIHDVVLLVVLAVWIGPAYLAGRVADRKGRSFRLFMVAGLLIGPLVLLGTLLLPRSRRVA
jgi:hypothetical protein